MQRGHDTAIWRMDLTYGKAYRRRVWEEAT